MWAVAVYSNSGTKASSLLGAFTWSYVHVLPIRTCHELEVLGVPHPCVLGRLGWLVEHL